VTTAQAPVQEPAVSRQLRTDRDLTRQVAKASAAALAVAAVAFGLWQVRPIVILLLLALTFAAAMRPGVEWLEQRRIPQSLAIALFFVGTFARSSRHSASALLPATR